MKQKDNVFKCRLVYNRTGEKITCYNGEGEFIELLPNRIEPLPDYEFGICYIVDGDEYEEIKASGRTTDDLCRTIDRKETGRSGVEVVYLESYDEYTSVERVHTRIVPCSTKSYERNDPEESKHHILAI